MPEPSQKRRRAIIPLLADLHSGSEHGLLAPHTRFWKMGADGRRYRYKPGMTERNKHLYNLFIHGLKKTVDLADGDEIIPFMLGDATQGGRFPGELITARYSDQVVSAFDNLSIVCQMPNVHRMFLAYGTGVHVGGEGSSEEIIARWLELKHGIKSTFCYHGVATVAGCQIDYAHHGPGSGIRQWTRGNIARIYLTSHVNDDLQYFKKPPRVYIRAHYHVRVIEERQIGNNWYTIIVAPPFVMPGEYPIKVTQSNAYRVTNGVIALEIIDGDLYKVHEFTKTVDLRTRTVE